MSYTYNKIMSADGNEFIIQRVDEEGNTSYIPADPANSDYQAYLNPVEHLTEILPTE